MCFCRYRASAWDRSCPSVDARFLAEHNALVTLLSMIDIQPHGSGRFFIIVVAQPTDISSVTFVDHSHPSAIE